MNGIPPIAQDVDALAALLRQHIDQLAPDAHCSSALRRQPRGDTFGHLLTPTRAASPDTSVDPALAGSESQDVDDRRALARLDQRCTGSRLFRSAQVRDERHDAYNLHVCALGARPAGVRLDGLPA